MTPLPGTYRAATVRQRVIAISLLLASAAAAASIGLPEAARHQQKAAVEELLKQHSDINATDVEGMTALIWAAHWNDLELARRLLGAGANPNVKSAFDDSAIYEACVNGNAAMVEALLKAGADANASRGEGETARRRPAT